MVLSLSILLSGCALNDPEHGIPVLRYESPGLSDKVTDDLINNNYEDAIKEQTTVIERSPSAANYRLRAHLYATVGQYDLALRDLNEAIEEDPKDSRAYFMRAEVYAAEGDYPASLSELSSVVSKFPKDADMLAGYAKMRSISPAAQMRDSKEAIAYATRACDMTSWQDPLALSALAGAYANAGNFDHAVNLQKDALARQSDPLMIEQLKEYEKHQPYRAKNYFQRAPWVARGVVTATD